jgi:AhpC/TSA family
VISRLTFFLLAVLVASVFGQGPLPVKAGDLAPGIVWNGILQPVTFANSGPGNLLGRVTVIFLFPNVSSNPSLVSRWNLLLARFADKPVNFVWITSESGPELAQWLQAHPVNGWLLLDSNSDTARAYGMETPGAWAHAVIVDPNGRIAGFTFVEPDEEQIRAVLEGRTIAIDGDANDAQLNEILAGRAVRLDAGPHRPVDFRRAEARDPAIV